MSNLTSEELAAMLELGETVAPFYEPPMGGMPLPIEMAPLLKFDALIENIVSINNMNAAFYMREFLKAQEMANSFYCRVMMDHEGARDRSKKMGAIAYLDKSLDYLKAHDRKATDEACKQYVFIDADYTAARDEEACLKALTEFLKNKIDKFQSAHDDAKKIYDQTRDPRGSMTGAPSGRNGQ